MRTLLARAAEDEDASVIFLREEFETGGVFKGMDFVLLGEFLGKGDTKLVEIGQGILGNLRAGGTTQEEGSLGFLDGFRGFFV